MHVYTFVYKYNLCMKLIDLHVYKLKYLASVVGLPQIKK